MKTSICTQSYLLFSAFVLSCTLAASAPAASIVDYGSDDYVTADANFQRLATNSGSPIDSAVNAFNTSILTPTTNLGGTAIPDFIGGYELLATNPDVNYFFTRQQIRNDFGPSATDAIFVQTFGGSTGVINLNFHSVFLFPTTTFSLNSVRVHTNNGAVANGNFNSTVQDALTVETGGQIYVNTATFNPQDTTLTRGSTLTDSWVLYDPAADLDANLSGSTVALGSALDTIMAIGVYREAENFDSSGTTTTQAAFALLDFEVDGIVIPEPTSAALLGGAALLLACRRRTR